jgi:hypothetical protein
MISESRKAIVAFLLAFLGPLVTLLTAFDVELGWRVVLATLLTGLVAGLGTYVVPNSPKV